MIRGKQSGLQENGFTVPGCRKGGYINVLFDEDDQLFKIWCRHARAAEPFGQNFVYFVKRITDEIYKAAAAQMPLCILCTESH
jgi:hypothetical protein